MSNPRFPDPFGRRELLEPGATSSGGGLSLEQRVAALEQGAASKTRPILYYANMHLTSATAANHSVNGYQKVGAGSVAGTWGSSFDVRPSGVSAQVDTSTNKRITIRKSGIYLVCAGIYFGGTAGASTLIATDVYVNGAVRAESVTGASSGGYGSPTVSKLIPLNADDYLELYAYRGAAGTSDYAVSLISQNFIEVAYVGPSV